ncbi:hypothetical protein MW887_000891 [Aspergillus wentii]|nr:hypothetical protein MW887_000891 [Aspergillus wentii]
MNSAGLINAYGVEICWQSTDFSTPAATATLSTSAAVTSTSQTTADDPSSSGLSSGAKAGVGVGVAIGGILIIAVACTFFFARRRKKQDVGGFQGDGMAMGGVQSTVPSELAALTAKAELSATSARSVIAEMDGR